MQKRCHRFLALLLSLATVLSLLPAGFALEADSDAAQTVQEQVVESSDDILTDDDADEASAADETTGEAETEADTEAAADADTSQEEPVQEAPVQEPAESDADGSAALQDPPAPSDAIYDTLSLEGTWDYTSAFAVQSLINSALQEDGASILMMDSTVLEAAMTRAAELAVRYSADRPSGESWSTVLGDAGFSATMYVQAISAGGGAQFTFEDWYADSTVRAALTGDESRSIGIGCFYQEDGTRYWVLIITNKLSSTVSSHADVSGDISIAYQESQLGSATLTLSVATLNVGDTATASLSVSNGYGSFVPAAEDVTYTSSNTGAVAVADDGTLTPAGVGSSVITGAISGTGVSASATVTAEISLDTVELSTIFNQNGSVKIKWQAVTGATGYQVWRKNPGGKWARLGSPVSDTSYTDTTVVSGTTYVYTVRAVYAANGTTLAQGGYDSTGLTSLYLATPTLSSASDSKAGVTVTWKSVTGAQSYDVYRKTAKTNWAKVANVTSTTYLDSNVTSGTQYFYTVRARSGSYQSYYNTSGVSVIPSTTVSTLTYVTRSAVNYRSGASTSSKVVGRLNAGVTLNVISGWSTKANGATWYMFLYNNNVYYVQASYLLATPAITKLANTASGLQITWNKVSNASGYYLYWRTASNGWQRIATITSASTVSYTIADTNLTSGTRYTFTLRAYYDTVKGDYSRTGVSGTYMKTPSLISAANNGSDAVTVTWEQIENAGGYIVYRKTSGSSWSAIATISSGSTTSYTDTGLTSMTTYTYTVRAFRGNARSSYVSAGISAIIVPSSKLSTYVVYSSVKYCTGPGTSYAAAGTLSAGKTVQIISGYSKKANNYTWYQCQIDGALYYIASDFLLATPSLGSVSISGSRVVVTWSKVSNADNYVLYRKTNGGSWSRIAVVKSSASSYTDSSVSSGVTYTYTVRAMANSVQSRYDSTGLSICYLSTPSLTSAAASKSGIKVSWGKVTGAEGYYVYRKLSGGSWTRIAQVSSGSTLTYLDDDNLLKGNTYYYTVKAYSGKSTSDCLSGVSAKATATVNPTTKSYVALGDVYYRDLDTLEEVGVIKKGATVQVIPEGTATMDGVKRYMIYKGGSCYYVTAKWLEEA